MTDTCAWCAEPSVTLVITVPGRAKRKTAPVCETHAQQFEAQGVMTQRLEADHIMRKGQSEWVKRTWQ